MKHSLFHNLILFIFISTILFSVSLVYSATYPNSNFKKSAISNNIVTSHFVTADGIKLHYLEMGKGPLVILLHGWPETSLSWNKTMPALATQYRVVAPDLRGLGTSEHTADGYDKKTIATDIKALIEKLGEKKSRGHWT